MPYPCDMDRYRDYEREVWNVEYAFPEFDVMGKDFMYKSLSPAAEFCKNHPDKILWCGEFGTIRHAKLEWREAWMRDVISFLKENSIPYCVWNYLSTPNDGNRFSLVDDDTRSVLSGDLLNALLGK